MTTVRYTCGQCAVAGVSVQVADRPNGQPRLIWLRGAVADAIRADHQDRSPDCSATSAQSVTSEEAP